MTLVDGTLGDTTFGRSPASARGSDFLPAPVLRVLHSGRSWLALAASAVLVSGCGGGCSNFCFSDYEKATEVSWQSDRYTIVTSPTGSEPVYVDALVGVVAFYVSSSDTVLIEPNAPERNPSPGKGVYPIVVSDDVQQGTAVVRLTVKVVNDSGTYPKGEFPFTAPFRHGDDVVVAQTTVVVQ